jgi:hypothetical protein
MWLLMPDGALSITVSPKDPTKLQVRARRKEWLDSFRRWCPELGPDIHTIHADYQWRALAKPEDVAKAVAAFTLSIDYSNFKNATSGSARGLKDSKLRWSLHEAYSKIWGTLLDAGDGTSGMQQPLKYKGSKFVASSPALNGTIGICELQGHWWRGGTGHCIDCSASNPNDPEPGPTRGPGFRPTPAEVKAWWDAHPNKAASVKRSTGSAKPKKEAV